MITYIPNFHLGRFIISILILSLILVPSVHAQTPTDLGLPTPGSMVSLTSAYVPVMVKGLKVYPENPVLFDFIVDTGNTGLSVGDGLARSQEGRMQDSPLRQESEKLIKYFLASLTLPEEDLWVNLSPYEKDRIVPEQLGQTEMGRDMLAQDYVLKQLTASLIYPEKELGKEFWNKVYTKAQALYGSTEIPVNTFNKVWIVADKAKVYVHDNTAFVVGSHLKVMLEEDYLASQKHDKKVSDTFLSSQIIRDIVLPELEKEVNEGKTFANLRQIFHSMILAAWYKKNLKQSLLNQVYSNKAKINGVDTQDKTIKEQIYQEYLKAYKKGVFNYIKDNIQNGQRIPRRYFSGGLKMRADVELVSQRDPAMLNAPTGDLVAVTANIHSLNHPSIEDTQQNRLEVLDQLIHQLNTRSIPTIDAFTKDSTTVQALVVFEGTKNSQVLDIFEQAAIAINCQVVHHDSPQGGMKIGFILSGPVRDKRQQLRAWLRHELYKGDIQSILKTQVKPRLGVLRNGDQTERALILYEGPFHAQAQRWYLIIRKASLATGTEERLNYIPPGTGKVKIGIILKQPLTDIERIKTWMIDQSKIQPTNDEAMVSSPGGIDLNSKSMTLEVTGDKINVHWDPAMVKQFQSHDFSGVKAIITKITPITNSSLL